MRVKGQREIFVDKANQAGVDVLPFDVWEHLFVKATAVAALEITEFHDRDWCTGTSQSWFSVEQQRTGELGVWSILWLAGRCQVLFQRPLHDERAANSEGNACQKPDCIAMRNLHSGFADAINAVMLMELILGCRLNGAS